MLLSDAYAELVRMGRIPSIRQTNAAIKQRFFEEATGMVPPNHHTGTGTVVKRFLVTALALIAAAATGFTLGVSVR